MGQIRNNPATTDRDTNVSTPCEQSDRACAQIDENMTALMAWLERVDAMQLAQVEQTADFFDRLA